MASHRASKRQIWENDFSPPERVLAPRPVGSSLVISGSTWEESALDYVDGWRWKTTYLKIQHFIRMVGKESTSETSFAQKIGKLCLSSRRNVRPENLPSLLPIVERVLEDLRFVSHENLTIYKGNKLKLTSVNVSSSSTCFFACA